MLPNFKKPKRDIPYREGCFISRYKIKPCFKRVPEKRVEQSVNEYILNIFNGFFDRCFDRVCVEEIANKYKIKHSQIDKYFRKLNRLGILSQAKREFAHDTNRNPIFPMDISGWCPNFYYFRFKSVEEFNRKINNVEI